MFYSLKDRLRRSVFGFQIRGILETEPLMLAQGSGLHVLSQLQHKDVLMYLAAVKSFAAHLPVGQVHVLDDGSLTGGDHSILATHVPGVQIRSIHEFGDAQLPRGGTWERLAAIAQISEQAYVVQLDADTLTQAPLPEVLDAVSRGRAFTIGTWDDQQIEPATAYAERAIDAVAKGGRHVQVRAEAALSELSDGAKLKYVRGCSGFAGFAASPGKLQFIRSVSDQMTRLLGATWSSWGSEQFMSNLLVANLSNAVVLPHPEYCDCSKIEGRKTRFIHFIGGCRFNDGIYAKMINRTMSL